MTAQDWRQGFQFVDKYQIPQGSGRKEERVSLLQRHRRREFRLVIVVSQMRNLVQIVIAKFRSHKQEASFEHVHAAGHWHSVEVLELDLSDHVFLGLKRDLEDVTLLGLDQEEEHGLGFVGGRADKDHATIRVVEVVSPPKNRMTRLRD